MTPAQPGRSRRRFFVSAGLGLLLLTPLLLLPPSAGAGGIATVVSFTNTNSITIYTQDDDSFGNADPFPSTLQVSSLPGALQSMTVTVYGLTDPETGPIELLLVGPSGQAVDLMYSAGSGPAGGVPGSNATITIADSGGSFPGPGGALTTGTYQPSGNPFPPGDFPYDVTTNELAGFIGTPLAGTWSLYEYYDDFGSDGLISGGWSLTFTLAPAAPAITNQAALNITPTNATLSASVDPNLSATAVYFEYGLTTGYGSFSATNTLASDLVDAQLVALPITGLPPDATIHFQAVARNSAGTSLGGDMTFATPANPPAVTNQAALSVTSTNATLGVTVNPNLSATTVYFEYGLTAGYGSFSATNTLAFDLVDAQMVALPITGLPPGTTIHFQAVAQNSGGTTLGGDSTFATPAPPPSSAVLMASFTNGATLVLTLSGNPGSNYTIVSATSLSAPIVWTTFTNLMLTNAVQVINPGPLTNQMEFFAVETNAPPALVASLTNGASLVLTLYGTAGSSYVIQSATSLSAPIQWTAFTNLTLTNAVQVINPGPLGNPMEFFRAAQQ